MEQNIGLSVILGDHTGEKEEPLDLLEELITLTFKENAHGQYQLILGLMISEMKPNLHLKMNHQNNN